MSAPQENKRSEDQIRSFFNTLDSSEITADTLQKVVTLAIQAYDNPDMLASELMRGYEPGSSLDDCALTAKGPGYNLYHTSQLAEWVAFGDADEDLLSFDPPEDPQKIEEWKEIMQTRAILGLLGHRQRARYTLNMLITRELLKGQPAGSTVREFKLRGDRMSALSAETSGKNYLAEARGVSGLENLPEMGAVTVLGYDGAKSFLKGRLMGLLKGDWAKMKETLDEWVATLDSEGENAEVADLDNLTFIALDLANLKASNDFSGNHFYGDLYLLKAVSLLKGIEKNTELRTRLGIDETVEFRAVRYQSGGDELGLIVEGPLTDEQAQQLILEIQNIVQSDTEWGEHEFYQFPTPHKDAAAQERHREGTKRRLPPKFVETYRGFRGGIEGSYCRVSEVLNEAYKKELAEKEWDEDWFEDGENWERLSMAIIGTAIKTADQRAGREKDKRKGEDIGLVSVWKRLCRTSESLLPQAHFQDASLGDRLIMMMDGTITSKEQALSEFIKEAELDGEWDEESLDYRIGSALIGNMNRLTERVESPTKGDVVGKLADYIEHEGITNITQIKGVLDDFRGATLEEVIQRWKAKRPSIEPTS